LAADCDVLVDPGAPIDGNGTRRFPDRRLAHAVARSSPGDVVCLRPGTLPDAGVTVPHALTIRGAGRELSFLPFDLVVTAFDADDTVTISGVDVHSVSWTGEPEDVPATLVVEDSRLQEVVVTYPPSHRYELRRSEVVGDVIFSQGHGTSHHVLEDLDVGGDVR